jgi:hypothetical protein
MSTLTEMLTTIAGLIVAVAITALIVSKKSQTSAVIQASGSAFSNALAVAESPVTGATYNVNLSYPGNDFSGSFGTA